MKGYGARKKTMLKRRSRRFAKRTVKTITKTLGYNPIYNTHKFKRFGESYSLVSSSTGVISPTNDVNGWYVGAATYDSNNTYQFGGAMQFQLDQCLEWKDFANLFDKYKINGVRVTIIPVASAAGSGNYLYNSNNTYPTIVYSADEDDASAPTSFESIAVKQSAKIKRLNKPVSIYIRPKLAGMLFDGNLTTAYGVNKAQYINAGYPSVPHYALKFWIRDCQLPQPPSNLAGAQQIFRIVTKFYLSCKDPQ